MRPNLIQRVLLASALLAVAGSAQAETDVGESVVVTGEVEVGGRVISGDDWGQGKFNEYREFRPGMIGRGHLLIEDDARVHYIRTVVDFVDEDDQHYELGIGRWGHYGIDITFDEFPHNYGDAVTPYSKGFNGQLFLPSTWDYANANVDLGSELDANSERRRLGFRQLQGDVRGFYKPSQDLEFVTGYNVQNKRGTQPGILTFGFAGFIHVASPIDETIHEFTAGARVAKETWSLSLDYTGSIFDQDNESTTVDNPLVAADTTGASHRGRNADAPDNSAHQISLSGAAIVPTSFPSRLAGTFSYGIRLQNESFLPYTVNSALSPADQTSSLPQNDLDGKVHTILGNLVYTARPMPEVNVEARYRIYDFDNDSDEIDFSLRYPFDRDAAGTSSSQTTDFRRQNGDLDVSYRISDPVTLRAGFGWEHWKRSKNREVRHSNELKGTIGGDYRATDWMTLSVTTSLSDKDGKYHTKSGSSDLSELRRYDVADKRRVEMKWRALFVPMDELNFSLSGGVSYDDYTDDDFGLNNDKRWNAGIDVEYAPLAWLSFGAYYQFDYIKMQQRGFVRGNTTPPTIPDTSPDNIWRSNAVDHGHNVGADANIQIVEDLLDARISYLFQRGDADTDTRPNNPNNPGASGDPIDFPDIDDSLHIMTSTLTWHVIEDLDLIGAYRFEDWSHNNFQTDPLGTNFGDSNVYLGNRVEDYTAHVFTISARYTF